MALVGCKPDAVASHLADIVRFHDRVLCGSGAVGWTVTQTGRDMGAGTGPVSTRIQPRPSRALAGIGCRLQIRQAPLNGARLQTRFGGVLRSSEWVRSPNRRCKSR